MGRPSTDDVRPVETTVRPALPLAAADIQLPEGHLDGGYHPQTELQRHIMLTPVDSESTAMRLAVLIHYTISHTKIVFDDLNIDDTLTS